MYDLASCDYENMEQPFFSITTPSRMYSRYNFYLPEYACRILGIVSIKSTHFILKYQAYSGCRYDALVIFVTQENAKFSIL
jgi:hypothetical protein